MNGESAVGSGFPLSLLTTSLALAGVLALAWVLLRAFARAAATRSGSDGRIAVVRSVAVGARERVVLVRHDGHDYLLGVAAGGISLLDRAPSTAAGASAERTATSLADAGPAPRAGDPAAGGVARREGGRDAQA